MIHSSMFILSCEQGNTSQNSSFFLSFLIYWHEQISIIMTGIANWEFWRKKNEKKKTRKIYWLCFWLNEEFPNWELTPKEKDYSTVE